MPSLVRVARGMISEVAPSFSSVAASAGASSPSVISVTLAVALGSEEPQFLRRRCTLDPACSTCCDCHAQTL